VSKQRRQGRALSAATTSRGDWAADADAGATVVVPAPTPSANSETQIQAERKIAADGVDAGAVFAEIVIGDIVDARQQVDLLVDGVASGDIEAGVAGGAVGIDPWVSAITRTQAVLAIRAEGFE